VTVWAVAGVAGGAGVTTHALALTAAFAPMLDRPRVMVEANPAGGVLAARFENRLRADVDLSHLAVAAKHGWDQASCLACARELWPGVHVVVAPPSGPRARAALAVRPEGVSTSLAAAEVDVIIDVGRLDLGSPALLLARRAVEVVFVGRCRLEDALLLRAQIDELSGVPVKASLLLVHERDRSGRNPSPDDVINLVGAPAVGVVPFDPRAAAVFSGGAGGRRRVARSRWWRSVREAASVLTSHAPPPAGVPSPVAPIPAPARADTNGPGPHPGGLAAVTRRNGLSPAPLFEEP
jgi:hypothetical protein